MNILIPIDFSESSLNALDFALPIASAHKAKIQLLYVFTEEEYNKRLSDDEVGSFNDYKNEKEGKLDRIAKEVAESAGFSAIEYEVLPGSFLEAVKKSIRDYKIDLIVMGSKGASNLIEKMIGTNTVKLIEHTDIPVLAIPANAQFNSFEKVVYASDYTEEDKIAVQEFINLMAPFKPELTVLHLSHSDSNISKVVYEDYKEEIHKFIKYDKVTFERKTYSSNIALGIDEFMLDQKSNLLAVLREKRNLVERVFHKSVSKQLTYLQDFPLLVFKCE